MADVVPAWADLIGRPFAYGGRGPDTYDCYGLVAEMFRRSGVVIPDYVSPRDEQEIAAVIAIESSLWAPCARRPGTAVAFRIGRWVSHVGFMVDHDRMLHAWGCAGGVCVERLSVWERRIQGFYEFRAP